MTIKIIFKFSGVTGLEKSTKNIKKKTLIFHSLFPIMKEKKYFWSHMKHRQVHTHVEKREGKKYMQK